MSPWKNSRPPTVLWSRAVLPAKELISFSGLLRASPMSAAATWSLATRYSARACLKGASCYNNEKFKDSADYRLWTDAGYQTWVTNRDLSQPANSGINATLLTAAQQR